MAETAWIQGQWKSADGLTLSYRDYPGDTVRKSPILCLHGLTRNARDFEPLAERFAGERRLIVPDMRGRGSSEYARDSATYALPNYVSDVTRLLEQLQPGPVAVVGTSMGGLIAMAIAASRAWPLVGVALNDIGPDLEPAGIERIRDYVGQARSFETWMHAARALRELAGAAHPQFELVDWLAMAKRVMCIGGSGRIVFDYDMKIAEPFSAPESGAEVDLWPAYRALAGLPVLILRGELSDLLSVATTANMLAELPAAKLVTVPGVGHPPTLAEHEAQEAIGEWLEQLA